MTYYEFPPTRYLYGSRMNRWFPHIYNFVFYSTTQYLVLYNPGADVVAFEQHISQWWGLILDLTLKS